MLYGVPVWFDMAGILALCLAIALLPLAVVIVREFLQRRVSLGDALPLAAVIITELVFVGYLHVWDLLGLHH